MILTDKAGVSGSSNNGKSIFKSPLVRVSILKKPAADSNGSKANEGEETNQKADHNQTVRSTGLQSLCQLYQSDEDD